ncbi:MAG: hypothetical protein WD061_02970 [Candidatus Saccharimonadales bacterium]
MSGFAEALLGTMGRTLLGIIGPTTMETSTTATATAYSNQRKVDRTQNGVLWAIHVRGFSCVANYSIDNGSTWTNNLSNWPLNSGGTTGDPSPNCSFFIDKDDYAHFVWKQNTDYGSWVKGYIYYRRGTPNAERTEWTWSDELEIGGTFTQNDYSDIVAHREGTGWVAHVVSSFIYSATNEDYVRYSRIGITSEGSLSFDSNNYINSSYGNTNHKWPSIDFNHTGDGKTVAGGTPHLYVAWSAGDTGAGLGIRFKKATYSGSSWTWGAEREISPDHYVAAHNYLNCLFDGTRVIIGGNLYDGGYYSLLFWERDVDDTATSSTIYLVDNGPDGNDTSQFGARGSITYDSEENLYFWGLGGGSPWKLVGWKWTRASLNAAVIYEESLNINSYGSNVSAKRGYSNSRIEFIYTDGTESPYDINFYGMDT